VIPVAAEGASFGVHVSGGDRGTADRCIAAVCNDPRGDTGDADLEILLDVPDAEIDRNTHCRHRCTALLPADNVFVVPESLADSQIRFAGAETKIDHLLIPFVTQCEDDVVDVAASRLSLSSGERNSLLAIDCDSLELLSAMSHGSVSRYADAASGACDGL